MTYPTPYEVGWYTATTTQSGRGSTTTYTPALTATGETRKAISFSPTREAETNETRVESDIDLFVPPDFGAANPKDVCDLPIGRFEVVGHPEDWTYGFHNWQPGLVIKLKRVQS